jgi:hypothetical protein
MDNETKKQRIWIKILAEHPDLPIVHLLETNIDDVDVMGFPEMQLTNVAIVQLLTGADIPYGDETTIYIGPYDDTLADLIIDSLDKERDDWCEKDVTDIMNALPWRTSILMRYELS